MDYTTDNMRSLARGRKYHDGDKLTGLDLSSAFFQNGSFGGADLRNVDLRDADLRFANMSKADLRGARLKGAKLEGVWWKDTICPDGSVSRSSTDGCLDHL